MVKVYLFLIGMLMYGYDLYGQTTTVTYTASTLDYANPERGIYHFTETHSNAYTPIVQATLQNFRTTENVTVINRMFYLEDFVSSPISAAYLTQMQTDFNRIRAAGLKVVVRFAYTDQYLTTGPYGDATKAWMLQHIAQIEPYLQANADVIVVLQAGFIGTWGEWYYTTYFGDPNNGNLTAANYADRKEITDRMLAALPSSRMIQLRTLYYKYHMYRSDALTPVSAAEAYNGTAVSRIGHFNDCFLASPWDFGTYINTTTEYPYLSADTKYVPMGGETCQQNAPRSDCSGDALNELASFHWSFLNRDYINTVWNAWIAQGCSTQIKKNLGYRLQLNSGTFSTTAKPGGSMSINLSLSNVGWAAFFNPRLVEIVLENTADGTLCRARLTDDPRMWMAGSTVNLNYQIGIPLTFPNGTYKVHLSLPDPMTSLYEVPAYSVRLANTNTTWDAVKGYNYLGFDLTINNSFVSPDYSGSLWFENCYPGLPLQWLRIKAEADEYNTILQWSVAQQKNNEYFSIERSTDGMHFTKIGKVNATEALTQTYQYTDLQPGANTYYYRVVQYDMDGKYSYSPVASISFSPEHSYYIAPNPFSDYTYIYSVTSSSEEIELIIQDVNGKTVTQELIFYAGRPIRIGEGLNSGVYFVRIVASGKVEAFKIVKL